MLPPYAEEDIFSNLDTTKFFNQVSIPREVFLTAEELATVKKGPRPRKSTAQLKPISEDNVKVDAFVKQNDKGDDPIQPTKEKVDENAQGPSLKVDTSERPSLFSLAKAYTGSDDSEKALLMYSLGLVGDMATRGFAGLCSDLLVYDSLWEELLPISVGFRQDYRSIAFNGQGQMPEVFKHNVTASDIEVSIMARPVLVATHLMQELYFSSTGDEADARLLYYALKAGQEVDDQANRCHVTTFIGDSIYGPAREEVTDYLMPLWCDLWSLLLVLDTVNLVRGATNKIVFNESEKRSTCWLYISNDNDFRKFSTMFHIIEDAQFSLFGLASRYVMSENYSSKPSSNYPTLTSCCWEKISSQSIAIDVHTLKALQEGKSLYGGRLNLSLRDLIEAGDFFLEGYVDPPEDSELAADSGEVIPTGILSNGKTVLLYVCKTGTGAPLYHIADLHAEITQISGLNHEKSHSLLKEHIKSNEMV
jgi:hypothetical protein